MPQKKHLFIPKNPFICRIQNFSCMKKFFLFAFCAPLACWAQSTYTISGTAVGAAEGDTVTVTKIVDKKDVVLGKIPVHSGKFTFKGTAEGEGPVILRAYPKDIRMGLSALVFTDGKKINVILDTYDENYDPKSIVSGTPLNDKYQAFRQESKRLYAPVKKAGKEYRDTTITEVRKQELQAQLDSLYAIVCNYKADFVIANIRNAAGKSAFNSGDFLFMPLPILKRAVDAIPEDLKKEPYNAEMIKYAATLQATEPGNPFIDIEALTPEGDTVRLSDYAGKGKYVLVDFWASWCGPCRASIPELKELYAKYHDKGFEVIGVSLDAKKDAWLKGIADLDIPWHQMSDVKLWNSAGAKEYGIKAIPCTILIDPDGKIVERNPNIKEKLREIFGE